MSKIRYNSVLATITNTNNELFVIMIDFYVSAAQDQTLRQDVTKKMKMNWGLLTYISTHKLLRDRLLTTGCSRRHLFRHRLTAAL